MTFDPDYGQTLLSDEEQAALTDSARELLREPILAQSPGEFRIRGVLITDAALAWV